MAVIELGGFMMWPLLLVSVTALAIVVERAFVFLACPFPDGRFSALLLEAASTGDMGPLVEKLSGIALLRDFARILAKADFPQREAALRLAGESIVSRLEAHLHLLSLLTRIAPLMGLLGTIFGMITTFSHIADAQSGVDMTQLASGIWQALLTTATGLCIAIPALFFLSCFQARLRRVAEALTKVGNTALLTGGGQADNA